MKIIDDFLNSITMYRLMLYFLMVLLGWAGVLSIFGLLPFKIIPLLLTASFIFIVSWTTNKSFAYVLKVPTNYESIYITVLILSLIITPINSIQALPFVFLASFLAAASKYILAINKKHIFNPAAIGVFISGLIAGGAASWWVGTPYMMPAVFIGGLLIVKKIKRWDLVLAFFILSLATISFLTFSSGTGILLLFKALFLNSPILFFAFVMLVEPLTSPPYKVHRIMYGGLVGFLFAPVNFGNIFTTPEMALVVGNVFSYLVSPKERLILKLKEKIKLAPNIYEFVFGVNSKFSRLPGQYMEWTLGYKKPDTRGNRRYFTIASSPTEESLRIGVRLNNPSSSYKKALLDLVPGDRVVASSLSGEFVLPKDENKKLVFIAGGIGVTPFRSMAKYLIDKKQKRDIVLFYSCSQDSDFVFEDIFEKAESFGLKTIYVCSHPTESYKGKLGRIDSEMIKSEVPDFKERIFYLSGPNGLVKAFEETLSGMGVNKSQIKTDYFPGY